MQKYFEQLYPNRFKEKKNEKGNCTHPPHPTHLSCARVSLKCPRIKFANLKKKKEKKERKEKTATESILLTASKIEIYTYSW